MKQYETEVLVIGSGIAGLFYSIHCAQFARVTIITKGTIGESNTMYAQGGIAAVFDMADSIENHIRDTLVAGDDLCNEEAVHQIVQNARRVILELDALRVDFDKRLSGSFDLHREGGHSHARVVHSTDATGKEVETALVKQVRAIPNITILEGCFAIDLCVNDNTCTGAIAIEKSALEALQIHAKVVMLASGGAGQVYEMNTNPSIATGDGFAMAHRAGAVISNMEFVQFHPTTLYGPSNPVFLITEALRGFGAELKNENGETFMEKYHPLKSLAPRDVVSRAIVNEMEKRNVPCVYLDVTGFNKTEIQTHFPTIYSRCKDAGIDIVRTMIPVVPAAHYMCGGVVTDLNGRTSIGNLYACGEVSCTGVHGANRLASNSLLEGLVFAENAAVDTKSRLESNSHLLHPLYFVALDLEEDVNLAYIKSYLQQLMWRFAGIVRNGTELNYCHDELKQLHQKLSSKISLYGNSVASNELLNLIETSLMIVRGSLLREESRGCQYRTDFPLKSDLLTFQDISEHLSLSA